MSLAAGHTNGRWRSLLLCCWEQVRPWISQWTPASQKYELCLAFLNFLHV